MTIHFQIYPNCKKPKWLKRNVKCHCIGEGSDILIVDMIGKNAAFLLKEDGETLHGWESFKKLEQIN